MSKTALITGITGQDGFYLAELLRGYGYQLHGLIRRGQPSPQGAGGITFHPIDLLDQSALTGLLEAVQPDEVYNLAAMSFVPDSWSQPIQAAEVTGFAVLRILEAIRAVNLGIRFFQATSSEVFGRPEETPQRETTPMRPRSPYASAKAYAHWLTTSYRETHGLYACSGILYNHESPRRRLEFVTRKITHGAAQIKLGLASQLRLGNLAARRDWGYAGEFVKAMWLTLQQDQPADYLIGTGLTHSVEDFVRLAFSQVGLDWRRHVVTDEQFYRRHEEHLLVADISKARQVLGWEPAVSFEKLVTLMLDADLETLSSQAAPGVPPRAVA